MKLHIYQRATKKKSEINELRREGKIPAVFYLQGKEESQMITVDKAEFEAILRHIKPGHLATTKLTLIDEGGQEKNVLIKDIHYKPTTYDVVHLDFKELVPGTKVKVKVPIECTGVLGCAGIRLGGVLRQVIRSIPVECLSENVPEQFELDVTELGLKESKKLQDLEIPKTIRPLMDLRQVVVVIAKR